MATRQKDRGGPEPGAPWDEIVPHLWMGCHDWIDAADQPRRAVVTDQFSLVISLYTRDGHGPDPGVEHLVAPIPDGPLDAAQIDQVVRLAARAADAVRDGRTTLVRCHAGLNRSGLVVAQALIGLGYTSDSAIRLIRAGRSPLALNNRTFVAYLETGLDIVGLDQPS